MAHGLDTGRLDPPASLRAIAAGSPAIALVHTADGGLHAIDRGSGRWVWSVHDQDASWKQPAVFSGAADVEPTPANDTALARPPPRASQEPPTETYIIEPGQSGAIFVRAPGQRRLQRLPFTLPQLVDMSPLRIPGQASRLFVGRRTTSLIGVDLASGELAGVFGADDGWCSWAPEAAPRRPSRDCESDIQQRPTDLLFLGRTEYRLSIYSTANGQLLHELAYTTYQPSSESGQSATQATSLQLLSDGSIASVSITEPLRILWRQQLPGPAIAIYDIVPGANADGSPALALQQPLDQGPLGPSEEGVAFVSSLDGQTTYALSQQQHPLLALRSPDEPDPLPDGVGGIGRHVVEPAAPLLAADRLIEGRTEATPFPPRIDGPSQPARIDPPRALPSGSWMPPALPWTVNVLFLALLGWIWTRRRPSHHERTASPSRIVVTPPMTFEANGDAARWTDKALPPLPPSDAEGPADAVEVESDAEDMPDQPRRKGRRRKRGKKPSAQAVEVVQPEVAAVPSEAGEVSVGSLQISTNVLGYGSHGTVVLKGAFQGRAVAVKRLLTHFVQVASHEVALLQESDEHPNVIRWICTEQLDAFLYIALELCDCSLADVVERPADSPEVAAAFEAKDAMRQIAAGVAHLHRLKLVHRDIKPQNVLVTRSRTHGRPLRMLISDFGLCKRLDQDASSFAVTNTSPAVGSAGWRAPEALRGEVDTAPRGSSTSSDGPLEASAGVAASRLTRAIDIFSLGALFFYVLTSGDHPFGGRFEREANVLAGNFNLDRLAELGDEAYEAQMLVTTMIAHEPRSRPTAAEVTLHPFFWSSAQRLQFLVDASDRFEICVRDPPEPSLQDLERDALVIVGANWSKQLSTALLDDLGRFRKYDFSSVRDLMRVLRNKKNHFLDLPEPVRRSLGAPPTDFLRYFTSRWPKLCLHVFGIVQRHYSGEAMFRSAFHVD